MKSPYPSRFPAIFGLLPFFVACEELCPVVLWPPSAFGGDTGREYSSGRARQCKARPDETDGTLRRRLEGMARTRHRRYASHGANRRDTAWTGGQEKPRHNAEVTGVDGTASEGLAMEGTIRDVMYRTRRTTRDGEPRNEYSFQP